MQNTIIARISGGGRSYSQLNKSFKAYTLAEVLISMAIIGIIAAITLPAVQKSMGDELEARKRKAFLIVSQIVDSMYNDDDIYPNSKGYKGFSVLKEVKYNGVKYKGKTKFCELFSLHFNKRNSSVNCIADELTFKAIDGMDWYLPVSEFNRRYEVIKFDVNGEKEPNCMYNETNCKKPDTFEYYLLTSGKLTEEKPLTNEDLFLPYPKEPTVPTESTTPTIPTTPTEPTLPSKPMITCWPLSLCGCIGAYSATECNSLSSSDRIKAYYSSSCRDPSFQCSEIIRNLEKDLR